MLVFCTHYHQIYNYIMIMTPTMYFVEFITFNHCTHHIPNLIKFTVDSLKISVVTFKIHAFVACLAQKVYAGIMLDVLPSYYAPNYAGIIGSGLPMHTRFFKFNVLHKP